jgi:hypothetical protein
MNWNEYGKHLSWPNFKFYSDIDLERQRKTTKIRHVVCLRGSISSQDFSNSKQDSYPTNRYVPWLLWNMQWIDRLPEWDVLSLFCDTFLSGVATCIMCVDERVKGCQSQSHIATDGQSVWSVLVSSPVWGSLPDIIPVRKLLSCLYGAPSLTRRRVCHLSGSFRSYVICQ